MLKNVKNGDKYKYGTLGCIVVSGVPYVPFEDFQELGKRKDAYIEKLQDLIKQTTEYKTLKNKIDRICLINRAEYTIHEVDLRNDILKGLMKEGLDIYKLAPDVFDWMGVSSGNLKR